MHKNQYKNLITLLFGYMILFASCNGNKKDGSIIIEGNIQFLPEGMMYMMDRSEKIDSAATVHGKFRFEIIKEQHFEPRYIQFSHISSLDSVKRIFQFPTKARIKSVPVSTDMIMLEENFPIISGKLKESNNTSKVRSCRIEGGMRFGKQSNAMYNDTVQFMGQYSIKHLARMLKEYPYSYHLLYRFERIVPLMSNKQALQYLSKFNAKLKNGITGKQIETYIYYRHSQNLSKMQLPDSSYSLKSILLPGKRIHLVILWASWCGPCRREIPQLKSLQEKFSNQKLFDMVSVSFDEKVGNWKKALLNEKMPWRQLIMDSYVNVYSKELFSFDGSIPTTLLVDPNGKIIKKFVGFDEKNTFELDELLTRYIENQSK